MPARAGIAQSAHVRGSGDRRIHVSITMRSALRTRVQDLANRRGISLSMLLELMIQRELDEEPSSEQSVRIAANPLRR